MKRIHYDHERQGWWIESRTLAWLVDVGVKVSRRVWVWLFVVAYAVVVSTLIYELASWMAEW